MPSDNGSRYKRREKEYILEGRNYMNIYEFMSENPILSFLLALIVGEMLVRIICNLPNRILRHWNIRKYGYPPPHCDADGDFRPEKEEEKG
jgi:hypothetical protein